MFLPDAAYIEKVIPDLNGVTLIAKGGQKLVFKGCHNTYGNVVIKFILDAMSDERLQREIEISTGYSIPNLPKLFLCHELESDGNKNMCLIEEYIEGVTLREYLKKNGKVPLSIALKMLEELLVTSTVLEKNMIVHRDIKPENIIIKASQGICLLDFGIARHLSKSSLTLTKAHFGPCTPGYAAPEQFRNMKKEIDIRADLFSIGVTVYEAILGEHPFITNASHPLDILKRSETITPYQFSIPGDTQKQLIGFLAILMDKFPSRRPKNAETALNWFYALLPTINLEEES
jgi:serine/threonine-protein kinase